MNALSLYLLFAKIGLFTFGGGYAMIPLFQDELVVKNQYISADEFANMVALAQMTPGPVGLNAATYIGYQQDGFVGALAGTLGVITPSLLLVSLAACFILAFRRNRVMKMILTGIRPAILGLIASAVIFFADTALFTVPLSNLWHGTDKTDFALCWQGCLVFLFVLLVQIKWKWNMILTLSVAGLLGCLLFLI